MQTQSHTSPTLRIEEFFIQENPVWKRIIDIVFAILCLLIFSPIMLAVAIAVKLSSKGPIIFKQKRVGEGGKTFQFFKFRSMYHSCDQNIHQEHIKKLSNGDIDFYQTDPCNCSSYKLQNDERVTAIGRFLRRTSLDEIPQLFNVLKGEMSFVGPRPYPVYQNERCTIWQRSRLRVKPGITGLSQIYGRFNKTYIDAYRLDLQYIKNQSFWSDLKILIKTVPLVISGRGAL